MLSFSPGRDDSSTPALRIRSLNQCDPFREGEYVLYWMLFFRRTEWNYSLQRAVEWAAELGKPLVVLESLRVDYPWASDRLHRFTLQGMADNAARFGGTPAYYFPYVEPHRGARRGLITTLAQHACVVVGDDFPCGSVSRQHELLARRIPCRYEVVDSNGLLPLRAAEKVFSRAHDFRRFLQQVLPEYLLEFPLEDPLAEVELPTLSQFPDAVQEQWPVADLTALAKDQALAPLPIDHRVTPVPSLPGGARAAEARLADFLAHKLPLYGILRNQPEPEVASGLSSYLHFGHLSPHQIFVALASHIGWTPRKLSRKVTGSRNGWWGASEEVEDFLDELITWREVGYNFCWQRRDYMRYSSLPDWARTTLEEHAKDPRPYLYSLEELEQAGTHDKLWNAAQRQLVTEGRIHNYLRMLWGKKILEWTATPREALRVMIELNNKYALDGSNPNSYSGIFWILGRYDRAWGPERPIFGKIRYMSSDNTARKLKVGAYLERYG